MTLHRAFALGVMLSSVSSSACGSDGAEKGGVVTSGEVEAADKKKLGFSITLPEGLKDTSEFPYMKRYGKEAKAFDGYSFIITAPDGARAKLTIEAFLAEAEKQKVTVLDKDTWGNGWYVVAAIEEGSKKAIVLQGMMWKGDVRLSCRGNVEGPLAADGKASGDVLARACKSLTITSP